MYVVTVLQPYNPKPSNPSLILHPQIQRNNSNGVHGNTSTQIYVDIYYTAIRNLVSAITLERHYDWTTLYSLLLHLPCLLHMQTTGHNWHVHENPPMENTPCVDAIGGHYNPFGVSLGKTTSVLQGIASRNSVPFSFFCSKLAHFSSIISFQCQYPLQ